MLVPEQPKLAPEPCNSFYLLLLSVFLLQLGMLKEWKEKFPETRKIIFIFKPTRIFFHFIFKIDLSLFMESFFNTFLKIKITEIDKIVTWSSKKMEVIALET